MIFWILLIAPALLGIRYLITRWGEYYRYRDLWVLGGIGTLFGWGIVAALIFFFGFATWMFPAKHEFKTETFDLAALSISSEIEGRTYFLGGGYIGEDRTLNYIRQDTSGGYLVRSVKTDDAIVYQGSDKATVTMHFYEQINPWLAPWSWTNDVVYDFNVPDGSILSDYTISNKE
jgi:hypothetical protein